MEFHSVPVKSKREKLDLNPALAFDKSSGRVLLAYGSLAGSGLKPFAFSEELT